MCAEGDNPMRKVRSELNATFFFPFFLFALQINSHPAAEYLQEVGWKLDRKSDGKGKVCVFTG